MSITLAQAIIKFKERVARPPAPPPEVLWAFWKYDQFPYFLSGKINKQHQDGRVEVVSYSGMRFKPFYVASGQHGEELHRLGKRIRNAYLIHEECARNAAGNYADDVLAAAGLPTNALGLKKTGWQGDAYKELFRKQMEQERD